MLVDGLSVQKRRRGCPMPPYVTRGDRYRLLSSRRWGQDQTEAMNMNRNAPELDSVALSAFRFNAAAMGKHCVEPHLHPRGDGGEAALTKAA